MSREWGQVSKTEFSQKLINKINETEQNWNVIYIDAFRFDHIDDPLVMLITQISLSFPKDSSEKKEFMKKAIPLFKVMGKIVGKAGISWLLKQKAEEVGEELSEAISEGSEDLLDKGIEEVFKDFEKEDEVLQSFKDLLAKIAAENRIVICIDELDRCRPSFALSLLEKVKHVFAISNVDFIFMANLEQIEAMVEKQYGYSIDAEAYLTKFFPVNIKLPMQYLVYSNTYSEVAIKYFRDSVLKNKEISEFFKPDHFTDLFFEKMFLNDNLSLRDAERFYTNIQIYNAVSNEPIKKGYHWFYVHLWLVGIYAYTFNNSFSNKLLGENVEVKDIVNFLKMNVEEFKSDLKRRDIVQEMFAFFLSNLSDSEIRKIMLEEDGIKNLNIRVNVLFNGSHGFGVSREERIQILKKVINTMQLV